MAGTVEIPTARGDTIRSDQLGAVLMHEHIFLSDPDMELNYPTAWDEQERIADAVRQFRELKARGIDSLVDLTVVGLGRDVALIRRLAEQVEVNIIVATGLYTYDDLPLQFGFQNPQWDDGREVMLELFAGDIVDGIAGTGVRAGILKCAVDAKGVTPGVERVLRACAKVHHATGVPISTHTNAATKRGLNQQRILREEGVDLERVVIGHCGDTTDLDYLRELMAAGSTLGMDRFGIDLLLGFDERVDTVARLCAEGYAGKMTLSHDASAHFRWVRPEKLREIAPNWHYLHVPDDVIPELRRRGVTQEQVDEMMVHAPRRVFEAGRL